MICVQLHIFFILGSRDEKINSGGEADESKETEEENFLDKSDPDPSTREGRLELYKLELEKKTKKFLAKEKKNRGRSPSEIELEKTRAFKIVTRTPSPEPEDQEEKEADKEEEADEEEEDVPDVPGEEIKEGDDGDKSPEPCDGLSPRTRAKNRVANVIAKINNIVPPETYKPEPEEEIRPEAQMKVWVLELIVSYFNFPFL